MGGLRAQQSAQPSPTGKSHGHIWKTAKVVLTTPTKRYLEEADRTGQTTTVTVEDTLIFLENDEFSYILTTTQQSGRLPLHHGVIGDIQALKNHHACRFVVNDDVQFYQDKKTLHVIDADGKECKAEIFMQARVAQPAESK
jgi:hypothetical protein